MAPLEDPEAKGTQAPNLVCPRMNYHARTPTFPSTKSRQGTADGTARDANEHTSLLGRVKKATSQSPGHEWSSSDNKFKKYPAKVVQTTWDILKSNYANVLLVFVPLGILAGPVGWPATSVFILNFLAIIPLAGLLAFATEELAAHLGQTIGGLLNATFGNAVELIVSIVALREGQIRIVQSSMLGSILSNMLLVLGCCFIAGGIHHHEQSFEKTVAQAMSSLMLVASASLILPATLYAASKQSSDSDNHARDRNVITLSRGTAVILLVLYILFLYFQLRSHADLFDEEQNSGEQPPNNSQQESHASSTEETAPNDNNHAQQPDSEGEGDDKKEGETLSPIAAGIALVLITVCVAVCAEFLVDSIDAIVEKAHISKTFIGLILLPIVGNAAEHVTAVVVSYKDKMNLALGVAIGSSIQIALFVTPALVLLGWAIGQDMTLKFEPFETVVFFLSVLVVSFLIMDGKCNYLEGCMCIGTYVIIALAFYVYPDEASSLSNFFSGSSSGGQ